MFFLYCSFSLIVDTYYAQCSLVLVGSTVRQVCVYMCVCWCLYGCVIVYVWCNMHTFDRYACVLETAKDVQFLDTVVLYCNS